MRDAFLTWFEEYNKLLCQLVSMLNDEEIRAEPVVRKLLLGGGPTFLKVDVDNELLKEHLYWGDRDVEEMYYCIGVTKVLWFEIKNVLSPYGERHIRNINVPHELYELDVWGCKVRAKKPSLLQLGERRLKGDFRNTTNGRADKLRSRTFIQISNHARFEGS
ncbi:hypothetical protein J6590_066885 [Homalodisca vitripennis]|nr:hypothetical protein J6590_066885 [Homalodisca vitripennis]